MIASTTAFLGASRFGLAPSSTKTATAGLKLVGQDPGLKTGDPAGFSAADALGAGALGHGIGIGVILGLRALGKL
jgi:photosystem I subunit 10